MGKLVSTDCAILFSSGSPCLTFPAEAQKSHFEGCNLLSSSMCSVPGTLSRKLHGKVPTKIPPWSSTSFWPSEEDWVLNPTHAEVNNAWIKRNSWSLRKTERCNTLYCLNWLSLGNVCYAAEHNKTLCDKLCLFWTTLANFTLLCCRKFPYFLLVLVYFIVIIFTTNYYGELKHILWWKGNLTIVIKIKNKQATLTKDMLLDLREQVSLLSNRHKAKKGFQCRVWTVRRKRNGDILW